MSNFAASGTQKFAAIATSSGDTTLVAAVTGKRIRLLALCLTVGTAANIRFESGTGGTALSGVIELLADTPLVLPFSESGWLETAAATLLNLEQSGVVAISGMLVYQEIE